MQQSRGCTKHVATEARRERALQLRAQDNLREHRHKVRDMLVQKLAMQHGCFPDPRKKASREQVEKRQQISAEVEKFVAETEFITEPQLKELETVVADKLAEMRVSTTRISEASSARCASRTSGDVSCHGGSLLEGTNDWKIIDAYAAVENEARAKRSLEETKRKQKEFKSQLDAQVRLKQSKSASQVGEAEYARTQSKLLEEWRDEMEEQRQRRRGKYKEEKKVRDLQVAMRREAQAREAQELREAETRELEDCRRAIESQRAAAFAGKVAARERSVQIRSETEEERKRQAERKRQQGDEDQRMMEEFKAKLDREESARQSAFAARVKRLERFSDESGTTGAGFREQQLVKNREERILAEAKKKEQADMERERRDREALKRKQRQIALENARLSEEKRSNNRKQVEEEKRFADRFVRESQDYLRAEADKMQAMRQDMVHHQNFLRAQIAEAKAHKQGDDMDHRERRINKALLDKIKRDPAVVAKLEERLGSRGY